MKSIIVFIIVCLSGLSLFAQNAPTTIILLRHAEKESTGNDPSLSPAGLERSYKLQKALKEYKPDHFYSTDYKRTKQTVTPWANATGKEIEIYNADELAAFAEKLKAFKGKTIIVAGHSNTTPQLANLLLGNEKYTTLNDAEYSKIWILTIEDSTATDKIAEY